MCLYHAISFYFEFVDRLVLLICCENFLIIEDSVYFLLQPEQENKIKKDDHWLLLLSAQWKTQNNTFRHKHLNLLSIKTPFSPLENFVSHWPWLSLFLKARVWKVCIMKRHFSNLAFIQQTKTVSATEWMLFVCDSQLVHGSTCFYTLHNPEILLDTFWYIKLPERLVGRSGRSGR